MHLLLLAQSADPTGLAHGRWPAPWWAICLVGGFIVAIALSFFLLRALRARRRPSSTSTLPRDPRTPR